MWQVRCPYCTGTQGRCAATAPGRWVTECCSCGRVVEERQVHPHQLFLLRAHDNPLYLVTPDLSLYPSPPPPPESLGGGKKEEDGVEEEEDPFEPTGFITAFSTWSLEPVPIFARSSYAFSGHLAELERALDTSSSSSAAPPATVDSSGPLVSVDHLRAYLQIVDVSSILDLDHDIADHAFQLFRDCSSTTCLRNRSIEALATAALVQAIREAQEPRTLQEISTAANLPQKEIGKYIKILGEALKLSQPINSNSISVHMPRFCTLLQLNKSAQELAAHIGEVVINKCFCTRRNPISISAAAIYLACQLEDKRKTQAEICKVTGLTEVTLRKVYKELLENWDDLLPPNYTPAVPPEKAFPMTAISSGRSSNPRIEPVEISPLNTQQDKERQPETTRPGKTSEVLELDHQGRGKEVGEKSSSSGSQTVPFGIRVLDEATFWQSNPFGASLRPEGEEKSKLPSNVVQKVDRGIKSGNGSQRACTVSGPSSSNGQPKTWPSLSRAMAPGSINIRPGMQQMKGDVTSVLRGTGNQVQVDQADTPRNRDE